MSVRAGRYCCVGFAVAAAAAATIVCVWLMAALNRNVALAAPEPACIRCVMLESMPTSRQSLPTESTDAAAETSAEIMTVDLDAPAPPMPSVVPLDLDVALPAPDVDAVRVAVRQTPAAGTKAPSPAVTTALRPAGATSIYDANRVDQPPREPAGNAKPAYPQRERDLGIEGSVKLKILIDERGHVADVEVVSGADAFRREVLAVVHSWRFEPARHQGKKVKVWGVKEINFTHPKNRP